MTRQLPALGALRVFLTVAQTLSFKRAAAELHVTPAAVTHRIKALESSLGVQLLRRTNRRVELTEAAHACLPDLREAFERVATAVQKARAGRERPTVRVSVAPSFAAKWLLPRLDLFSEQNPEIDVIVAATAELTDFRDDTADVAIRFGIEPFDRDISSERLLPESMAPMCSPVLADRLESRDENGLKKHTLIHDTSMPRSDLFPDWDAWFRSRGVNAADEIRGPRFTLAELALHAAVLGHGIVLGRTTLAAEDLATGRLVRVVDHVLPCGYSYFVLQPRKREHKEEVTAFVHWLLDHTASQYLAQ